MTSTVSSPTPQPTPSGLLAPEPLPRTEARPPRHSNLVRAELFKMRTTHAWWVYSLAILLGTVVMWVIDAVNARGLLGSFASFLAAHRHGPHGPHDPLPADFVARLHGEWLAGHSATTQAVTLYTANQLTGLLLVCLLGIVIVTSEFHHRTATTTFLVTPTRGAVIRAKLVTSLGVAGATWAVTTLICLLGGAAFLHSQGVGTALSEPSVWGAMGLNLIAYLMWAVLGVGFGALGATSSAPPSAPPSCTSQEPPRPPRSSN